MRELDWSVVWPNLRFILEGVPVTLVMTFSAMAIGLTLGLPIGLIRLRARGALRIVSTAYVELFRNTPVLVQIIWMFYALPAATGFPMPPIGAAIIALGLNATAYLSEIFRAGVLSLPAGQEEAARSLGMSGRQSLVHVIVPQAIRVVIPPTVNQFVVLMKGASLVAFIGVLDIVHRGNLTVVNTGKPVEIYTTVAVVYLTLILIVSFTARRVERRLALRV